MDSNPRQYEPAWPFIFLSVDTRLNFLYNQGRMVCPILANRRYGGVSKFLSACTEGGRIPSACQRIRIGLPQTRCTKYKHKYGR